jgi:hypothetical protein
MKRTEILGTLTVQIGHQIGVRVVWVGLVRHTITPNVDSVDPFFSFNTCSVLVAFLGGLLHDIYHLTDD